MKRSPATAHLRVYDTGHSRVAVYYIDILDEQHFVGVWKRAHVGPFARQFARLHQFDAYAVEFVWLRATVTSSS